MRYSTWDWTRQAFAVYEDQRPAPLMGDAPHCASAVRPVLGMVDVNMMLCPLPADARQVGWSAQAVGRLSRAPGGMLGVGNGGGRRSPNLGMAGLGFNTSLPIVTPNGMGYVPALGATDERVTFTQAVMFNLVTSLISGILTTWVFKKAFRSAEGPG